MSSRCRQSNVRSSCHQESKRLLPTGLTGLRNAHRQLETGTPAFFESLGYGGSVTDVSKTLTGGSGDGGVDGVIDQDRLGLDRLYVQAKR